jgi:hypothetical protein
MLFLRGTLIASGNLGTYFISASNKAIDFIQHISPWAPVRKFTNAPGALVTMPRNSIFARPVGSMPRVVNAQVGYFIDFPSTETRTGVSEA